MTDRRKGDPMLATFDPYTRTYSDGVVRTDTVMAPDPLACWKHSWIGPGLPCPECAAEVAKVAETPEQCVGQMHQGFCPHCGRCQCGDAGLKMKSMT